MALTWAGPTAMAGAIAYVYYVNHLPTVAESRRPPVSTKAFATMMFLVYALGAIGRNRFFPDWWYKGNVFDFLYRRLYCSELVGYRVLKNLMHHPQPYPHSDFRAGIRCLTEVRRHTTSEASAASPASALSAAAAAKLSENLHKWRPPCLDGTPAAASAVDTRSAATASAAALEVLQRQSRRSAAAAESDTAASAGLFAVRGGLPVDMHALRHRRSDLGVIVLPVPIFADNYSYLIFSLRTKKVCLVDPADPMAAVRCVLYLKKHLYGDERSETQIKITDILTTHKHWDHAGGNKDLVEYATSEENAERAKTDENICAVDLHVYGPSEEPVHFINRAVVDGDAFKVCDGAVRVDVLATPGHTAGSVVYVVSDALADAAGAAEWGRECVAVNRLAVFTGDALFSGGIGAPFETTSTDQVRQTRAVFTESVKMKKHPVTGEDVVAEDVLLYVGHEYTQRMLEEMNKLMAKLAERPEAAGSGAHVLKSSTIAYRENLEHALADVLLMRTETDGLEDAAHQNDDVPSDPTAAPVRNRLPLCTVPSTLALELKINPLLTMQPNALDSVETVSGEPSTKDLERAIYLSLDRQLSP